MTDALAIVKRTGQLATDESRRRGRIRLQGPRKLRLEAHLVVYCSRAACGVCGSNFLYVLARIMRQHRESRRAMGDPACKRAVRCEEMERWTPFVGNNKTRRQC